jgi:stress response protein SCP2
MANLAKEPFIPETVAVDYGSIGLLEMDGEENSLAGVEVFEMGLAWDKSTGGAGGVFGWVNRKVGSDLDAVMVAYTGGQPKKYLGWDEVDCFTRDAPGSAVHSGDNQTGEGEGDDETIRLKLDAVPKRYDKLVLVATAFKPGSSMKRAKAITVTLYDCTGGQKQPVGFIEPSLLSAKNTMGVAVLTRQPEGHWTLRVTDRTVDVRQGDRDNFLTHLGGF